MTHRPKARFAAIFLTVLLGGALAMLIGAIRATNVDPATLVMGRTQTGSLIPMRWPAPPPSDTATAWPAPDMIARFHGPGYTRIDARAMDAGVPGLAGAGPTRSTTHQMEVERFGWPRPVLERSQLWWPWNDPQFTTTSPNVRGFRILWPALVGLPLVLAVGVAGLAVGPGLLLRRRRRHRGLCQWCGYDVRLEPRCSECGASVPAPRGAPRRGSVADRAGETAARPD